MESIQEEIKLPEVSVLIPLKDTKGNYNIIVDNELKIRGKKKPSPEKQEKFDDLVASIKSKGVLQPIIVVKISKDKYKLAAGDRRLEAIKIIAETTKRENYPVPITIVPEGSLKELLAIAFTENTQRDNLTIWEESCALAKFINEHEMSVKTVAELINKSVSHVTKLIKLQDVHPDVQDMFDEGKLRISCIEIIASIKKDDQPRIAREVVEKSLSVKHLRTLIALEKEENNDHREKLNKKVDAPVSVPSANKPKYNTESSTETKESPDEISQEEFDSFLNQEMEKKAETNKKNNGDKDSKNSDPYTTYSETKDNHSPGDNGDNSDKRKKETFKTLPPPKVNKQTTSKKLYLDIQDTNRQIKGYNKQIPNIDSLYLEQIKESARALRKNVNLLLENIEKREQTHLDDGESCEKEALLV